MINIAIFGAGNIGIPAAYYLSKNPNYKIKLLDKNSTAIHQGIARIDKLTNYNNNVGYILSKEKYELYQFDYVISCLPYHQNFELAKQVIGLGKTYIDLGGNVDISKQINKYATQQTAGIAMTDMGLAPGLISYLSHIALNNINKPISLTAAVGGLPDIIPDGKTNEFNYSCTWNPDGLINEYFEDCEVLCDGGRVIRNGMSGYELFQINNNNNWFEMFRTSGGIHGLLDLAKQYKLINCEYKTIRYAGHIEKIKFLAKYLGKNKLKEILIAECLPMTDIIYIMISTTSKTEVYNYVNSFRGADGFSAMQRMTAIPLVAALNCLDRVRKRYIVNKTVCLSDFYRHLYKEELDQLGLILDV